MKAAVSLIQAVLILLIAMVLVALSMPWAVEKVGNSMDITELNSIKSQFVDCDTRIIETARTGSTNKCIFNIKRGEISGRAEGIYYKLVSSAPICDPSPLTEVDHDSHIWQECNVSSNQRMFGMLWKFPSSLNVSSTQIQGDQMLGQTSIGDINFTTPVNFTTLTLYVNFQYQTGQTGSIVELSRTDVTQTNVTLKIKIS